MEKNMHDRKKPDCPMYQSQKVILYMYEIVKEKKRNTLTTTLSNQPLLEIYFFKNP